MVRRDRSLVYVGFYGKINPYTKCYMCKGKCVINIVGRIPRFYTLYARVRRVHEGGGRKVCSIVISSV